MNVAVMLPYQKVLLLFYSGCMQPLLVIAHCQSNTTTKIKGSKKDNMLHSYPLEYPHCSANNFSIYSQDESCHPVYAAVFATGVATVTLSLSEPINIHSHNPSRLLEGFSKI